MKYFAYGSNLLHQRLQARTSSARPLYTGTLYEHSLRFHKIGDDQSGKCDCFFTGRREDMVMGLVYELDPAQQSILDQIEGVGCGYEHRDVTIHNGQGEESMFTYVVQPDHMDPNMAPFQWYWLFVMAGAVQNKFPESYLTTIRSITCKPDPDRDRASRNRDILNAAGEFVRDLMVSQD